MLTSEWLVLNRPSVAGFHSPGDKGARQSVILVVRVHAAGEADLLEVVQTGCRPSLALSLAQSGQQKRRQNRDDGDNDQQFNQCERTPSHSFHLYRSTVGAPVGLLENHKPPEPETAWQQENLIADAMSLQNVIRRAEEAAWAVVHTAWGQGRKGLQNLRESTMRVVGEQPDGPKCRGPAWSQLSLSPASGRISFPAARRGRACKDTCH